MPEWTGKSLSSTSPLKGTGHRGKFLGSVTIEVWEPTVGDEGIVFSAAPSEPGVSPVALAKAALSRMQSRMARL